MEYQELGSSGIKVSEVCLGTWTMGKGGWVGVEDEESIKTIHTALDQGINFIDTAQAYGFGHSEELIGKALKGRREEAIVCSKAAHSWDKEGNWILDCSYDFMMRSVEAGLKRMQTDYFDVYLVHDYNPEVPLSETIGALAKLKDQKVIRAVGVSRFDVPQLKEAGEYVELSAGQYPLNIYERYFDDIYLAEKDLMKPIEPVLEYCQENNIGIMAYGAVGKGLLAGRFNGEEVFPEGDNRRNNPWFKGEEFKDRVEAVEKMRPIAEKYGKTLAQLASNWVLCQPGVTSFLIGVRSPEQVKDNAGSSGWRLDQEGLEKIEKIAADIKLKY